MTALWVQGENGSAVRKHPNYCSQSCPKRNGLAMSAQPPTLAGHSPTASASCTRGCPSPKKWEGRVRKEGRQRGPERTCWWQAGCKTCENFSLQLCSSKDLPLPRYRDNKARETAVLGGFSSSSSPSSITQHALEGTSGSEGLGADLPLPSYTNFLYNLPRRHEGVGREVGQKLNRKQFCDRGRGSD